MKNKKLLLLIGIVFSINLYSQTVLPIELISFSGRDSAYINNNCLNILNWDVATQLDNNYYTIERSSNGIFWEFVSKVNGDGTTSKDMKYKYVDNSPYLLTYYRLSQTDYDGKITYFPVIFVSNNPSYKLVAIIKIVNLLGENVTDSYNGVKVYYFSNGTYMRVFKLQ